MCNFYQKKFSRLCVPFHNPVDLDRWLEASKKDWKANTPFRIMYRGHHGFGIQRSLVDICDAVHELYQAGRTVQLDITLTPGCDKRTKQELERPGCVTVQPIIPYEQVPASLASADLLVLTYDFDPASVTFNRYSMPTKATEFMASGTPVLIYGSNQLAVTEYARREKWGEIVAEPNKESLIQKLVHLMEDQALREKLGARAKKLAVQNHDAVQIREAFRHALACASSQS
jgi:glycosyltransferase involved in cell wall biosynthesis